MLILRNLREKSGKIADLTISVSSSYRLLYVEPIYHYSIINSVDSITGENSCSFPIDFLC